MKRKGTNRIFAAFLLSMLMILSMGMSVFAETAAAKNISITNAKDGSIYSAYQIMTAEVVGQDNEGKAVYNYTVADSFKAFFDGKPYGLNEQNEITKDGTVITGDRRWLNDNTTDAAALAAALSRYAIANKITPAATIGTTAAALPIGYYVVAETQSTEAANKDDSGAKEVATKPILVDLTDDTEITLKDDTTDLEKVIVEGNEKVKTNNVSIGDDVNFQITTKIPTYEANVDKTKLMFELTDTFSEGLTYNNDSLNIAGFTADKDYTAEINGQVLTITFTQDAIYNNQGKAVVATYSAKLNEKAKVDSTEGNPNDVTLEYTNNTNEDESHKYLNDETKTFTYGFNVHKVDKVAPSTGLADAKFQLKGEDGTAIKFVKDGDTYVVAEDQTAEGENITDTIVSVGGEGLATVKGLEEGSYTLRETEAPDKYTKLADDVIVTITAVRDENEKETGAAQLTASGAGNAKAEGGTAVVDENGKETGSVESDGSTININVYVENAKGISLPETGRNSALYCMIGGAALIIFGALYYIIGARRRRA